MKKKKRLRVCASCKNKGFDSKQGLLCKITGCVPDFHDVCGSYISNGEKIVTIHDKAIIANNDKYRAGIVAVVFLLGIVFIWKDLYYSDLDTAMAKFCPFIIVSVLPIVKIENRGMKLRSFFISSILCVVFMILFLYGSYGSSEFTHILPIVIGMVIFYCISYFGRIGKKRT